MLRIHLLFIFFQNILRDLWNAIRFTRATTQTRPPYPPSVWLTDVFPLRLPKGTTSNEHLLKLRNKYGGIVRIRIPFGNDVVVCLGTEFAKAYHDLSERTQASILSGFESVFRFAMPKEFTDKVTSDSKVNGFLRTSLNPVRFKGFIELLRGDIKTYFATHWNKEEMEIDLFPEIYKMVVFFLFKCLIGPSTQDQFEEFYSAFKDLDVEEGLKSPLTILNNYTFGWPAINKRWIRWKKVVESLINRPTKPENSDLFFDELTKNTLGPKGKVDLPSLATRTLWIFFAGSANNFAAISWLLVLIYSPENAKILAALKEQAKEYQRRYESDNGIVKFMTYESKPHLRSLLDRSIQEVVRKCAAALSVRKVLQDVVINNNEQQFSIRKGSVIALAYGTVMNDPRVFKDGDEFNPDRYLTEGIENDLQIAFGSGQHPCTGRHLVSITIKTFLYLFFEHFEATSPGKASDFFPQQQPVGIFRPPRPVMFKLRRIRDFDTTPVQEPLIG